MILYPAIDLLDGRVVRLHKGEFDAVTDYGDDPRAVAEQFGEAGAVWIHVVDLSGARDGARRQGAIIRTICETGLRVQTGGGVRTAEDIEDLLASGVERVIVGSLAVTEPERVRDWLDRYGGDRLTLALDVRQIGGRYRPALKGWTDTTDTTLEDVLVSYAESGLAHALVTDIGRDGDLSGPNIGLYTRLATDYPDIAWQASGGVASLEDLRAAKQAGAAGAITGKALYEGRFTVAEAVACLRDA
ncbi:1-(5-phosphoribosyl)-5-[(5-phosphoribosylamino)methylideneamino]imidazole-4-carboxamide isomerase [Maricaulis maris]|uniref:1-(5-phosphoribosyl)-5-[(5-phosphoribosylamino)methylideneamino] imidazole-4-carboxamide isomerase n=1 Tax=Maricaulis maris TaxID=74318 RepID=A0A495DM02_9PROT|nr:1-(5-phosphoribosyl)-5-[(5-phosphoribosylamino)methylideneamino]imidazole-4-carboxamide isomerase [Maricaulis maris]RKR02968.1 1-(5-phosphoribosyl)-5-[(5-phosphoribosylamino)methylideneamino] imidazole-4-carboxamide isomerase [Maricaulis maris]